MTQTAEKPIEHYLMIRGVPEDLRRIFKAQAVLEGRSMSDIVTEFIRGYVKQPSGQGGDLE